MKCKLGDYIRIKHGFAFKGEYITAENNGVVLVTPGNFEIGGGFKEDKCKFFNGDYPKEYVLSPYDLIVTMTDLSKQGDTLGYSALVPKTNRVYLHNQRIGLVDVYNPKADKMFIYWLMRTQKYQKTIVVQATTFSEKITLLMNTYYNGLITNEEVIKELLKTAEEINALRKEGEKLGLTEEELAFYDALTKPEHIKDFYENETLIALTRELTEMLRKNRTIDWQKKETARAGMRKMVKRLLKKYKYPPEKREDAIETVMSQCELWTDNMAE